MKTYRRPVLIHHPMILGELLLLPAWTRPWLARLGIPEVRL